MTRSFVIVIFTLMSMISTSQTLSDLKDEFEFEIDCSIAEIHERSYALQDENDEVMGLRESREWNDERFFEFDLMGNLIKLVYHYPSLVPYRTWEYLNTSTEPQMTGLMKITRRFRYEEPSMIIWEHVAAVPAEGNGGLEEGLDTSVVQTRIQYMYGNTGLLAEKIEDAQNGSMIGRENFEYENNLLVRYTKGDFSIEDWCEFKYDDNGVLISKNCSMPGKQRRKITSYEYEDGSLKNMISRIFDKGEEEQTILWSFGDGYAEEMRHVNRDGEVMEKLKIEYSFDERGNWIYKKLMSLKSTYVITREIKYRK